MLRRATGQRPAGFVTVPVAASSIPGAPPAFGRAAQGPLCFGRSRPKTGTVAFRFHQNVPFLLFTFALRPETKVALEAQTWLYTTNPTSQPGDSAGAVGLPALPAQQAMLRNIPC